MTLELSFIPIMDILSLSTAIMLGLLFLTIKSDNKRANIFLGLFLWSLSLEVLQVLAESFTDFPIIAPVTGLFTILFLFLYIKQTINTGFKKWYLLLFIPGIIINVIRFLNSNIDFLFGFDYVFNIFLLVHILKELKNHKAKLSHFYSDLEYKTLSWIKTIVFIFLGFHILWIIEDIISYNNDDIIEYFAGLSSILTCFMIYWIGYNGFSQSEIFKSKLFINTKEEIDIETESDIIQPESNEEFLRLKTRIVNEKLFANKELNLRNLASILDIKEKKLSKLINLHSQTNFYKFINTLRVEEFKKLIESPKAKQLSILGLAEEAGFSSKSTFYSAFKSIEGMTPKQYQIALETSK